MSMGLSCRCEFGLCAPIDFRIFAHKSLSSYMQTQEHLLSQVGRAPHLPSSRIALEIWNGEDETIGFEDVLGDEELR